MLDATPTGIMLPANVEIEYALLGAIMVRPSSYNDVGEMLRPDHFSEPLLGRIYGACVHLIDQGVQPNPVRLIDAFRQDTALEAAGGGKFLVRIASSLITTVNSKDYAEQIVDLWKRRQIIQRARDLIERAQLVGIDRTADAIAEQGEVELSEIAGQLTQDKVVRHVGDAAEAAIEASSEAFRGGSKPAGVPTGIKTLDAIVGGLEPEHLVIIAGRPSMGKSALATSIGLHMARTLREMEKQPAILEFHLEMTDEQVARRRLAALTGIGISAQKFGRLAMDDFSRLLRAKERLAALPIWTDDAGGLTVDDLVSRAKRFGRRRRLGLIQVDHIGLIRPTADTVHNRVAHLTHVTQRLKELAKELGIPVVALSQLSRDVEKRDDKRPMLADLRDSGSIEQDADLVMFVYRPEYYLKQSEPQQGPTEKTEAYSERHSRWQTQREDARGVAEVIVAKQRDGATGVAKCFFEEQLAAFRDGEQREMDI